jgi:hypothetical protein
MVTSTAVLERAWTTLRVLQNSYSRYCRAGYLYVCGREAEGYEQGHCANSEGGTTGAPACCCRHHINAISVLQFKLKKKKENGNKAAPDANPTALASRT